MKKEKQLKLKDAKGELREVLKDEDHVELESTKSLEEQEELLSKEEHIHEDHYHGVHHFDKQGHHDDISEEEFSIKSQFPKSKKSLTFRIAMGGLILALAIAFSAIDSVYEAPLGASLGIEVRFLDITVIMLGIPVVGFIGSLGIAIIEPWFHWLVDNDHTAPQIALDSIGYAIAVVTVFTIFYLLFRNSPIHKDPNPKKELFKEIIPGFVIVPILTIVFTAIFWLTALINKQPWPMTAALLFTDLGIQLARFVVMYILFVLVERVMKPVNHRYR